MKKALVVLFVFLSLMANLCLAASVEELISEKMTAGALENLAIMDVQIQTRKSINGGVLVQATVPCSYDVKKEQVKPTLLAATKELKKAYPKCEWIVVFAQVAKGWYLGRSEYTKGIITINYNILDEKSFIDYNKEWVKEGNRPIKKPTREEFLRAIAVDDMWQKNQFDLLDPQKKKTQPPDVDKYIAALTASRLQITLEEVVNTRSLLRYYMLSSEIEKITLN